MKQLTFSDDQIQDLFGHEAAEDEDLQRLRSYYFRSATYDQFATDLPLRILVGHKGIGKSALFQVAIAEDREDGKTSILIKPDDVSTLATDTSDFLRAVRSWKSGLIEIVAAKALSLLGKDTADVPAQLARFGGNLLLFLHRTFEEASTVNVGPTTQMALKGLLRKNIMTIYVDDLDRGWEGRHYDVLRISTLLNAVRDLVNENPGLRFRISLRSDVYYLVRTSDESTDKIEGSVIWQKWSNHEIFVMLVKRIETFFDRKVDEKRLLRTEPTALARYLNPVMESRFAGAGKWGNAPTYRVLMTLIRKRPRDLVKLCTLAARNAYDNGSDLIRTHNFTAVFAEYSQGRLQDTINEYRSELPGIERLLLNMKPNKRERAKGTEYVYDTGSLLKKLNNTMQSGAFHFAGNRDATRQQLAAFLYKINFLTARKRLDSRTIQRKYFEENRYLSSAFADFGYSWEVHPAYRWALQPDFLEENVRSLELSADEPPIASA